MKSLRLFFLLLCSGLALVSSGQETEVLMPEKSLSEVWIMPIFSGYFGVNSSLADFRKLAPESDILNRDYGDFDELSGGFSSSGSTGFSVLLGFRLKDAQGNLNNNRILRVGFNYGYTSSLYTDLYKTNRTRVDTLVSNSTGDEFFVDSVSTENVNINYKSHVIALDASLVFKTDAESRWSLYGGIGMSVGISLNPFVEVNYSNFGEQEGRRFDPDFFGSSSFESERINTQVGFNSSLYFPGGVDFRLGNKPFWQRTHLVFELRPSVMVFNVPGLETYAQLGFAQSFALRVVW
jgi:hypothetical protein